MNTEQFLVVFDECADRLVREECDLQQCLRDYPEWSNYLAALLPAVIDVKRAVHSLGQPHEVSPAELDRHRAEMVALVARTPQFPPNHRDTPSAFSSFLSRASALVPHRPPGGEQGEGRGLN